MMKNRKALEDSFRFAAPKNGRCDALIIAGEHSGDEQASRMLSKALAADSAFSVCAFGGRHLEAAGAQLLYDMTASSVLGLFEVLKNYSFFKNLAKAIVSWIETYKPKAVCFVDYPGLNLHIAKELKKRGISVKGGGSVKCLFYISPQIWAWKAKRRFKMEKILDSVATIFPFEVDCYKDTSLPATFVGHPFLDESYKLPLEYDECGDILLLPGSRSVAVSRILPCMLGALEISKQKSATIIYPDERIKQVIDSCMKLHPNLADKIKLVRNSEQEVFKARAALMSSGTMSLNCALSGIPAAILYKANVFTYFMVRLIIKIKYLGISNILLGGSSMPEYIQFAAKPETLARRLAYCLENPQARKDAKDEADRLRAILSSPSSMNAGTWLLESVRKRS